MCQTQHLFCHNDCLPQNQTQNCRGNFSESNLSIFHSLIPSKTVTEFTGSWSSTAIFFCKIVTRAALFVFLSNLSVQVSTEPRAMGLGDDGVDIVLVPSPWCVQTDLSAFKMTAFPLDFTFLSLYISLNVFNLLAFIRSLNFIAGGSVVSHPWRLCSVSHQSHVPS